MNGKCVRHPRVGSPRKASQKKVQHLLETHPAADGKGPHPCGYYLVLPLGNLLVSSSVTLIWEISLLTGVKPTTCSFAELQQLQFPKVGSPLLD